MALQLVGTGVSLLGSLFGFGHAKAVRKENNALGAADSFIQQELSKLEVDAREGRFAERDLDSRFQAVMDGYFKMVAGVIKGRIASESDWNPVTKKTAAGGPCNAACVTGGRYADVLKSARPGLVKLIREAGAGPKTIQASGGVVSGNGRQGTVPAERVSVTSFPLQAALKCGICLFVFVGALTFFFLRRLLKRRRNA